MALVRYTSCLDKILRRDSFDSRECWFGCLIITFGNLRILYFVSKKEEILRRETVQPRAGAHQEGASPEHKVVRSNRREQAVWWVQARELRARVGGAKRSRRVREPMRRLVHLVSSWSWKVHWKTSGRYGCWLETLWEADSDFRFLFRKIWGIYRGVCVCGGEGGTYPTNIELLEIYWPSTRFPAHQTLAQYLQNLPPELGHYKSFTICTQGH